MQINIVEYFQCFNVKFESTSKSFQFLLPQMSWSKTRVIETRGKCFIVFFFFLGNTARENEETYLD